MSEDLAEPETEKVETSDGSSAPPPARIATGSSSGGRGGGKSPSKPVGGQGLFARIAQFLRDTRAEMKRVSWPNATTVKNTTIITLVAVVFFSLYLFAVDRVWAFLIEHLRTWLGG